MAKRARRQKIKITTHKEDEYPYIRAWGKMMGSFTQFIDDRVEMARAEHAPQTAIFKDVRTLKWHIAEDVQGDTIQYFKEMDPLLTAFGANTHGKGQKETGSNG